MLPRKIKTQHRGLKSHLVDVNLHFYRICHPFHVAVKVDAVFVADPFCPVSKILASVGAAASANKYPQPDPNAGAYAS